MGSSSEASAYLSAVKWGDEGYYLKEFSQKFKLPQVAKIIKGQYQNLGVPSLPSPTLNQIVFVASAGIRLKVVAQCVKFKDAGRRMVPIGNKLSVPENYDGWFEILSEDGRSVKCIESVAELAKRNPRTCLVRDSIKVHLPRPEEADSVWDKTKTLPSGEILEVGEMVVSSGFRNSNRSGKFLKCVSSTGGRVYLPLELRCRFSTIAGEENISGVHTIRNLMGKRFPLMVRLVHGKPPVGVKSGSQFAPEMRLFSMIEEESLVALPLLKECAMVSLPTNAALKVLAPRNSDVLTKLSEHGILIKKCQSLMLQVTDCIQVCSSNSVRELKHVPPSPLGMFTRRQTPPSSYRTIPLVKRSASDPQGTNTSSRIHLERGMSIPVDTSYSLKSDRFTQGSDSDDYRYEEIDQIYDYVRGFAPLPLNIKNEYSLYNDTYSKKHQSLPQISQVTDSNNNTSKTDRNPPPEPPPIDTIPIRKISNGTIGTIRPVQPPHKITVSIVNKAHYARATDISNHNHSLRKHSNDHVYERIEKRKNTKTVKAVDNAVHSPMRSNSASKVFLHNSYNANNINKLQQKGGFQHQLMHSQLNKNQQQQNHQTYKFRFLKHSKSSPAHPKELSNLNKHPHTKVNKTTRVNGTAARNLTTSPLFHIRYKSLTDLLVNNKSSLDSSNNSSGKKMEGSAGSYSTSSSFEDLERPDDLIHFVADEVKTIQGKKRLSRPKSLSNLIHEVAPRRKVNNHNYYNLVQNDLIRLPDFNNSNKFYSMPDSTQFSKNHYGSTPHKKLGTLYL